MYKLTVKNYKQYSTVHNNMSGKRKICRYKRVFLLLFFYNPGPMKYFWWKNFVKIFGYDVWIYTCMYIFFTLMFNCKKTINFLFLNGNLYWWLHKLIVIFSMNFTLAFLFFVDSLASYSFSKLDGFRRFFRFYTYILISTVGTRI